MLCNQAHADDASRLSLWVMTDGGDYAVADRAAGAKARHTGTVEDQFILNDNVKGWHRCFPSNRL
jgi:hypothetical protein